MGKFSLKKSLIIGGLIVTVFAGNALLGRDDQTSASLNHVSSKEDFEHLQYQISPGLKKAEKKGESKVIHKDINIPNTDKYIHIEKMWLDGDDLRFLYSVDTDEKADMLKDPGEGVPKITAMKIFNDDTFLKAFKDNNEKSVQNGIYYNHRIYYSVNFGSVKMMNQDPIQHINIELPVDITMQMDGKTISINDAKIPIRYDYRDPSLKEWKIDKSVVIRDHTLQIERLVTSDSENALYVRLDVPANDVLLKELDMFLLSDQSFWPMSNRPIPVGADSNEYVIHSMPFNEMPSSLDFIIKGAGFLGNDKLEFDLKNIQDLQHEKHGKTYHKLLLTAKQTNIYLEKAVFDSSMMLFTFKYEDVGVIDRRKPKLDPTDMFPVNWYKSKQLKSEPAQISGKNEKGEEVQFEDFANEGTNEYGLKLNKEFIQHSNDLHFEVKKFQYSIQLDKEFHLDLSTESGEK
ncbi:hypothetical protein [Falsibacillus albus]|uniref:DUF4179 domain-containing protein n=1 Tax=Falsibacillus albus TaxID=2478915 RepID=A0A3L7JS85_9BACI|nr:hypothetical protein [Falsibacillus albus]RLQ93340.1 hypothetical protein D9X91_17920 [Falsibacillus albus]